MQLNTEQRQAVESNHTKIACNAAAGSGKTRVLVERVNRLVADGVNTNKILCLTFTNAAAALMASRYMESHPDAVKNEIPQFRTFHALCLSYIIRDENVRKAIGYKSIPRVATEQEIIQIITTIKHQLMIKLGDSTLMEYADEPENINLPEKDKAKIKMFNKAFRRELHQQGLITFNFMLQRVCELFSNEHESVEHYRNYYSHVLVDEMQDTDPKQMSFLNSLVGTNLFVVYDASQSIYGFRGADSSIVKAISKDPAWEQIRLPRNYRSTKQICDFSNKIVKDVDESYRLVMQTDTEGEHVHTISFSIASDKSRTFGSDMKKFKPILESTPGDWAIIARTNKEVANIKLALEELEIPYMSTNQSLPYKEILKAAQDDNYATEWLSTKLTKQKYVEFLKTSTLDDSYFTLDKFGMQYGADATIAKLLGSINFIRLTLKSNQSYPDKVLAVLKEFEVDTDSISIEDMISDTESLDIEAVVSKAIKHDANSRFYVGTIHSVKGLEYDNVLVLGMGETTYRQLKEESRNLYYVACTRAKKMLWVTNLDNALEPYNYNQQPVCANEYNISECDWSLLKQEREKANVH